MKKFKLFIVGILLSSGVFAQVKLSNIVAFYSFSSSNSSSLSIEDESGNYNNAAVYNGIGFVPDRNGVSEHAANIGGESYYYNFLVINEDSSINSLNNMNGASFVFWYRKNETPATISFNYSPIISIKNSLKKKYELNFIQSSKQIQLAYFSNTLKTDSFTSISNITNNVWYCIAFTIDFTNKQMAVYINGTKEGSATIQFSLPSNPEIDIAKWALFSATYDDFSIYNRVLSQDEVKTIYINCTATLPVTQNIESCSVDKVEASNGTNYNWYKTETGGSPVSTNNPYFVSITKTDTLYVSNTADNCESQRVPLIITVKPNPLPLGVIDGKKNVFVDSIEKYSVESRNGSMYYWTISGGTGSSLTNEISVLWKTEGKRSIKVYEVNNSQCNGDEIFSDITVTNPNPPKKEIVALYHLNGNANDASDNGNNGTIFEVTPITDRLGNDSSALKFDGINDYISIENTFDFPSRTISFWFKAYDDSYSDYRIIYCSDNPNLNYGLVYATLLFRNNGLKLLMSIANVTEITYSIVTNKWYQVSLVSTSDSMASFFVDGKLVVSQKITEYLTSNAGLNQTIIGSSRLINGRYFKGELDEMKIYNYSLTASNIDSIYSIEAPTENVIIESNCTFKIYPNPTKIGYITIYSEMLTRGAKITVKNIAGITLKNIHCQNNPCKLYLTGLLKGMYFVEFTSGRKKMVRKLIIE